MKINIKWALVIGALLLLLGGFLIGRSTKQTVIEKVPIVVPGHSGQSPIIVNPTPLPSTTTDTVIIGGQTIVNENPINEEIANKYIELGKLYSGTLLEQERLKLLLSSTQEERYEIPFEDDYIKITGNFKTYGKLLSTEYKYDIKPRTVMADVPVKKPSINILGGPSVENNLDLTKFNVNAKLGLQRRNGDLILGSYGIFDKSVEVGYLFKF
ncbi:MAG TPA: hypothetical protein VF680_16780 [Allosphingosinicella sp.]|jgi:hypothetical protein